MTDLKYQVIGLVIALLGQFIAIVLWLKGLEYLVIGAFTFYLIDTWWNTKR